MPEHNATNDGPRQALIAILEAEIAKREEELTELKERRNMCTLFCGLPKEIMEYILLLVQTCGADEQDIQRRYSDPDWSPIDAQWVRIMLACRYIRQVALGSPALWSTIDLKRGYCEWNRLCLERCGNYPMEVCSAMSYDYGSVSSDDLSALNQLSPRASGVRLILVASRGSDYNSRSISLETYLSNNSEPRTILLTSLEIVDPNNGSRRELSLPGTVLGGSASHLTYLLLGGFAAVTVPAMPRLQHLVLRNFYIDQESQRLHSLLQQTPALLSLHLHCHRGTEMEHKNMSAFPPVSLPLLSALVLDGEPLTVARVLLAVEYPQRVLEIRTRRPHWAAPGQRQQRDYDATHFIQHRVLGFLHKISELAEEAIVYALRLELEDDAENSVIVAFSPLPASPQARYSQVNGISQVDDPSLFDLACHAIEVEIRRPEHITAQYLSLLSVCVQMRTFVVWNVDINISPHWLGPVNPTDEDKRKKDVTWLGDYKPEDSDGREVVIRWLRDHEALEYILSTWAGGLISLHRKPLEELVLKYSGNDPGCPSPEVRDAVGKRWRETGWVQQVQWIEAPSSDDESVRISG